MGLFRAKFIILIPVCFALFAILGCAEKERPQERSPDRAAEVKPFVIAVLPQQNVFLQKKRYNALADYLSEATGLNVKTKLLDSYDAIYNEILNNEADAAVFGSLSYIVMNSRIPMDPIARPIHTDGSSTYKGLILALKGRGITADVKTWKGRRIALVSRSTTAGYIFPKWYLRKHGVKDFGNYFEKVIYTGSHDASIIEVFRNNADIGCASDEVYEEVSRKNPVIRESLVVIASSAAVPADTIGIRTGSDAGLRKRIKEALLNMGKTAGGKQALSAMGAIGFIETKQSEFGPLLDMLSDLGMKPGDFALDIIGRSSGVRGSRNVNSE